MRNGQRLVAVVLVHRRDHGVDQALDVAGIPEVIDAEDEGAVRAATGQDLDLVGPAVGRRPIPGWSGRSDAPSAPSLSPRRTSAR